MDRWMIVVLVFAGFVAVAGLAFAFGWRAGNMTMADVTIVEEVDGVRISCEPFTQQECRELYDTLATQHNVVCFFNNTIGIGHRC